MGEQHALKLLRPTAGKLAYFAIAFLAAVIISALVSSSGVYSFVQCLPAAAGESLTCEQSDAVLLGIPPFYTSANSVAGVTIPASFDFLLFLANLAIYYLLAALIYEATR